MRTTNWRSSRTLPGNDRSCRYSTTAGSNSGEPSPRQQFAEETLRQRHDVVAPLAQRRQAHAAAGDAVVQVAAKAAAGDFGIELAVRGADQPELRPSASCRRPGA